MLICAIFVIKGWREEDLVGEGPVQVFKARFMDEVSY